MTNRNNPAGRLHDILKHAANIGDGVRTEDVWAEIFQIPRDDPSALWHSILEIHKLYEDTLKDVENVEILIVQTISILSCL